MSAENGAPFGAPELEGMDIGKENGGDKVIMDNVQDGGRNTGAVASGTDRRERSTKTFVNYKYQGNDEGPYRVVVQRDVVENSRFSGINKINVGMILKQNGFSKSVIDIKKTGRNKVMVYMLDMNEANRLTTCKNLDLKHYRAYIPKYLVMIKGVINGIPENLSEQELVESIDCGTKVEEVFRMMRSKDGKRVPSSNIGVVFRGNKLPGQVKLFSVSVTVKPYITKTVMCQQCLRYGHIAINCKGRARCENCGDSHDEQHCNQETKCANCNGKHRATEANCPAREQQTKIKTLMAHRNLTYFEARQEVIVPTRNSYSILEHAEEFMTIQESYAQAVSKKSPGNSGVSTRPKQSRRTVKGKQKIQSEAEEEYDAEEAPARKRKVAERAMHERKPEPISMEQHLELRKKWEEKLREMAEQREAYTQMANDTFKNLSTAVKRNDESSYTLIVEAVRALAQSLGYLQGTGPDPSSSSSNIQDSPK